MAALSSPFSVSRTPATTKHMQTFPSLNEAHARLRSAAAHWQLEIKLTFEDNLQLVPQNVKDAVTGARLRYDMSLQPTPAGVLVEIITRLHRLIHVLQKASGFEGGKDSYVVRKQLDAGGGGGLDHEKQQGGKMKKTVPLTCSNTVCSGAHTVEAGAKQLSWKRQCQHLWEGTCCIWQITSLLRKGRMLCEMKS